MKAGRGDARSDASDGDAATPRHGAAPPAGGSPPRRAAREPPRKASGDDAQAQPRHGAGDGRPGWRRRAPLDARLLVWLLVVAFLTGLPLTFWFHADADAHAAALPAAGLFLRAMHGAATTLLVLGAAAHLTLRVVRGPAPAPGLRAGARALLAAGGAAITGAMVAQTGASQRILASVGAQGETAVLWTAVGHIAFASLLVLLTVYLHVAKWGWRHVLGAPAQGLAALLATAALAAVMGTAAPGSDAVWRGATWIAVPPVPVLWAWTALLALAAWWAAPRLAARRGA